MKPFTIICIVSLLSFTFSVNAQEGAWKAVKTINSAPGCSECGMATVNGKLYLVGGDEESAKAVMSFDPATNMWTKLAVAPLRMHHFEAVPYENKVYVLEAFSEGGFPDQVPMANVYSYDTQKDSWEKGGEMPQARRRAGAGAAAYNGKLYLVAGIQHGHSSGTTNMFDSYDPQTQAWNILPDAPHIRDHCSAAVINDKLYVVGGRNTSFRDPENKIPFFAMTVAEVDVYDFKTGQWSTLQPKLPQGSGGGAVVNLNGVLYYMGGERATTTEQNAPRKNTYYLNPLESVSWKETDSLHKARNGMAASVIGNKIYVAGGSGGPGGPPPGRGPGGPPPGGNSNSMPPPNPQQGVPGNRPGQGQGSMIDLEVFLLK